MQFHSDFVENKFKAVDSQLTTTLGSELTKKLAEMEDRSRRNNLRFDGFIEEVNDEKWEVTEEKVKRFIKEDLGISDEIKIERAHRFGSKYYEDKTRRNRTIIAKFLDYKDKDKVIKTYREKRIYDQKVHFVNEDFSEATAEVRKGLFAKVKDLKRRGIKAYVNYNRLVFDSSAGNQSTGNVSQHD